jgi:hypothetical protein
MHANAFAKKKVARPEGRTTRKRFLLEASSFGSQGLNMINDRFAIGGFRQNGRNWTSRLKNVVRITIAMLSDAEMSRLLRCIFVESNRTKFFDDAESRR